ncbi:MAG: hypothetical protein JO091_01950, partial [Acidobacteriaceae bacterium]|nr:hypothetical protein [Acidobacteriaceae bacterium]
LPKIDFGPAAQVPAAALPTWRYQLVSPADGYTYGGYMIGTNPFGRGARTTTIPAILVPVIITFQNTTSGFTATFDPSSSPDIGCTAGQTAMSLVENSPIFQNNSWILNGVNAGVTQYVDAFQRANFWRYVQNTGDSYHTLLSYTVGAPLMLTVSYSSPTPAAEVRAGVPGSCGNPSVAGSINGGSYVGIVDINTVHNALARYIVTNGMTPDQLPIFVTYNVVMTRSTQPGFYIGGYHFTQALYPQALVSPGQTYIMADFQSNNFYLKPNFDVSLLSHEVAEWMDDPGGFNFAPAWGHIGQENGCSQYLEVGDPLTGTNLATVPGPNGFLYHLQELAYFSWFFRTPSVGAATMFSDNGTFTTDAGPLCQ